MPVIRPAEAGDLEAVAAIQSASPEASHWPVADYFELLNPLLNLRGTQAFLEVRESNRAARIFYKSMGFQEVNVRRDYYASPAESAIVMKFHSC